MIKAPAGGMVSRVNGQEYAGGQFMPITGEFCGRGSNKISRLELDRHNSTSTTGRWIEYDETADVFRVKCVARLADGTATCHTIFSGRNAKALAKYL